METDFNINITTLTLARVTGGRDEIFEYKDDEDETSDVILEFRDREGWSKLGSINNARDYHGVSIVNVNDFSYCIN